MKAKTIFVCNECGYESAKWMGKCPACNSWNTFFEEKLSTKVESGKREKKIHMETIEEAITKVIAGVAKKSRVISEPERKLTAYHEAGHAVCAHVLPHVSPVHQVTIVPRGRAGGFTMQLPVEDKFHATKNEMKENIVVLLGGRVAEELTLDDISTGASNDLERVSATARNMVTKYGMSEKLGPMTFGDSDDEVFLGNSFASKQNYSEEVAYEIDKEIGRIVDESYKQTKKILQDNMDRLEYVAKALLVYETLDAEQFLKAFNKELPLDVLETKKDDETNNSEAIEKKETLSRELQSDTDLNRRDEFSQGKIDKDENTKSVIAELEKMQKSDVKNFDVDDIKKLDELEAKKSDIDEKKAGIKSKIDSLKNANKDLEHKIDTLNTEIAKCDFAWKNLFANKTWDEIEAKSMDGRFTKKEEKAKQEEPSKEEPKTSGFASF